MIFEGYGEDELEERFYKSLKQFKEKMVLRMNKILQLGSIVYLKQGIEKIMIIGKNYFDNDVEGSNYDFLGVNFPEGFNNKSGIAFNSEDIDEVIFNGYNENEKHINILKK